MSPDLPLMPLPDQQHLLPSRPWAPAWVVPVVLVGLGVCLVALYFLGSVQLQLAVVLGTLPLTGAAVGYLIFSSHRFTQAQQGARRALVARQADTARHRFEENARAHSRPVAHKAEAVMWVGVAALLDADVSMALRCLSSVEQWPGVRGWARVHEAIPGWMALAWLAQDEQAKAELWLAEAKRRSDATSSVLALLPEAVLCCRRGEAAEAARLLTREWTDEQIALVEPVLPDLRLVRAFALSQGRPDAAQRREIEALVRGASGGDDGTFTYLRARWQAFDRFVAAHEALAVPEGQPAGPARA